jgi:cytochrome c556
MPKSHLGLSAAVGLALIGIPAAVLAQQPSPPASVPPTSSLSTEKPADDPIATRQEMMKRNGRELRTLTQMSRGQAPFDADKAATAFSNIAAQVRVFLANFPEDSKTGEKTRALPAIWENKADFEAIGHKVVADATAAAQSVKQGGEAAFKTAFQAVGQGCNGCHDKYRRPQQ